MADLLDAAAWSQHRRSNGPWRQAATALDRGRRPAPRISPAANAIRAAARGLSKTGHHTSSSDIAIAALRITALLLALAAHHRHLDTTAAARILANAAKPPPASPTRLTTLQAAVFATPPRQAATRR